MQNFEDLGSALQLLGCNPIEVEPRWMRPTPKHRPYNAVRLEHCPSENQITDATADPYQIMEPAEFLAATPHSSPEREPGLSHSESSFEVVQSRTSCAADRAAVPGLSPHPEQNPAAPSVTSDQEGSAILPLLSSQSSCFSLPLGQKTIVRPAVAPAVPRLSDPARRPLTLRMPCAPVVRPSPRPRFSKHVLPFAPVQRPVPLRAADYHRPRPLLPSEQAISTLAAPVPSVLTVHSPLPKRSADRIPPGTHNHHKGKQGVCLQQDVHAKVLASALQLWGKLRPMLVVSSQVLQELSESHHPQELERRLLAGVSENTLFRYLQGMASFLSALGAMGLGMHNTLTQVHIADALLVMHREGEHVTNGLKAIRWAAKTLMLHLPNLYDGIMRTVSTMVVTDRKEALPFTAWILAKLELELLLESGPAGRRLFIGAVLTSVWASLRFSDSQHVKWDAILASTWCVRGTCFRTKTSRRGVPFGVFSWGIFGDASCTHKTWVAKYLQLLGEEWERLETCFGAFTPDCLFFTSNEEEFCPLSYGQVLSSLRGLLVHVGVPSGEASRFTLHSMKVTLLSILSQLGESESSRAAQGHHAHRESYSVKLYSRDDVWQALKCQEQVSLKLRSGWIPSTAQGRGGRIPVQQQSFMHLQDGLPEISPAAEHARFPFAMSDSLPAHADSSARPQPPTLDAPGGIPSDEAPASSSSDEPLEETAYQSTRKRKLATQASSECDEFLWILSGTGVLHLATKADHASSLQDPVSGMYLKPSCGCKLRKAEVTEPHPGARFCMHAACHKF